MSYNYNRRKLVLDTFGRQCYWCGCLLAEDSKYQPDSACECMIVPQRFGGRRVISNLVAACYACTVVAKRDMDTRNMDISEIRRIINEERRARHLPYNTDYVKPLPERAMPQAASLLEPKAEGHHNAVDEAEAEYRKLMAISAELDREQGRKPK